jgi:hypothetical protein
VTELPSSNKALGDVGNKMKSLLDTQESRKVLLTKCDQENSFIKPPAKTPLPNKKPVAPNKQTPNLKSAVRTPLLDIKATPQKKKQSLQISQNSATIKNEGTDSLLSAINAVENFINNDTEDLSWLQLDDLSGYEYIGLYNVSSPYSIVSVSRVLMDKKPSVSSFLSQSSLFFPSLSSLLNVSQYLAVCIFLLH